MDTQRGKNRNRDIERKKIFKYTERGRQSQTDRQSEKQTGTDRDGEID